MKPRKRHAALNYTLLSGCDLSKCIGIETTKPEGPSSVGGDTLIQSFHGIEERSAGSLKSFFLLTGMPERILQAVTNPTCP
ncbi:MAG TPA: hypothetical protein VJ249_03240 [Candidatus Bathyarchaeia archaeon]|nr:hypothetical protein [Candidatus Bathyarchaeia archaeon]